MAVADEYNMYDFGDLVRIEGALTEADGTAVDPTAVRVEVIDPAGEKTTHTFGTDPYPLKESTGVFYVEMTPGMPGQWHYAFISTGTGQAMAEGTFFVRESLFYTA